MKMAMLSLLACALAPAFAAGVSSDAYSSALERAAAKPHPRLFADAKSFEALSGALCRDTLKAKAASNVIAKARVILPLKPLVHVQTGKRILGVSRQALHRISTLAMAYRMTSAKEFLDRAISELESVISFSDWNPSHYLDTAEMALAVSIGYDWLYGELSDDLRSRIRKCIVEKAVNPAKRKAWWRSSRNNWGQVCRAGLIAASFVAVDDPANFADCAWLLKESVLRLPLAMAAMAPDGCYPEGVGYWHYGVSFNVFALAMLESACGTDFGLSEAAGFFKTADYPNYVTGPTGLVFGYADCGSSRPAMQALWWFARKLGRPDLISMKEISALVDGKNLHRGWLPPVELFWMDGRGVEVFPSEASLLWAPKGAVPIAVMRSGWKKDDAFVGVKGGSPSGPHGHMDGGNFILDMGGVRWAHELPCEGYTRIEQMKTVSLWDSRQNSGRWTLLRLNTDGHNVPSIDGAQQRVSGSAGIVRAEDGDMKTVEVDLTSLYPAAGKATRIFELDAGGRKLRISDAFAKVRKGSKIRWQFLFKAAHSVSGDCLELSDKDRILRVKRRGDGASEWTVKDAEGPKPLNSPNKGFKIASFTFGPDAEENAFAEVEFTLAE